MEVRFEISMSADTKAVRIKTVHIADGAML